MSAAENRENKYLIKPKETSCMCSKATMQQLSANSSKVANTKEMNVAKTLN